MLLEEGGAHAADDADDKKLRRGRSAAYSYGRYERCARGATLGILALWLLLVLMYYGGDLGSASASAGRPAVGGNGRAKATAATSEDAFPDSTNFLVMGDYGTGDDPQKQVARTLEKFAAALDPPLAFVLSTGDQIYEHGIKTARDDVLASRFEKMYSHESLQVPWYIVIGNHDCEGSVSAMLQYAKQEQSLWYMPQRYYVVERPVAPRTILRIVVVDACDLVCGTEPRNVRCNELMNQQTSAEARLEQYKWIDKALSAPKPDGVDKMWTIVTGHWAVYSFAGNADTEELIQNLDPLLKKHRVHAYFSGHDHSLQHLKKVEDRWTRNYFVSGAGGYRIHTLKPNARSSPDLVHAAMTHGFMSVHVTDEQFIVQFLDKDGEVLYTTEVQYD